MGKFFRLRTVLLSVLLSFFLIYIPQYNTFTDNDRSILNVAFAQEPTLRPSSSLLRVFSLYLFCPTSNDDAYKYIYNYPISSTDLRLLKDYEQTTNHRFLSNTYTYSDLLMKLNAINNFQYKTSFNYFLKSNVLTCQTYQSYFGRENSYSYNPNKKLYDINKYYSPIKILKNSFHEGIVYTEGSPWVKSKVEFKTESEQNALRSRWMASIHKEKVKYSELVGSYGRRKTIQNDYPGAVKLYEGEGPGVFDAVYWCCKGSKYDFIIVVEDKGGSGRLGTRKVDGVVIQQGHPAYVKDIALNSMNKVINGEYDCTTYFDDIPIGNNLSLFKRIARDVEFGKVEIVLYKTLIPRLNSYTTSVKRRILSSFPGQGYKASLNKIMAYKIMGLNVEPGPASINRVYFNNRPVDDLIKIKDLKDIEPKDCQISDYELKRMRIILNDKKLSFYTYQLDHLDYKVKGIDNELDTDLAKEMMLKKLEYSLRRARRP